MTATLADQITALLASRPDESFTVAEIHAHLPGTLAESVRTKVRRVAKLGQIECCEGRYGVTKRWRIARHQPAPAAAVGTIRPVVGTNATTDKGGQLEVLRGMLPDSAAAAEMLALWIAADQRYWGGRLRPIWLTIGIGEYGRALGHYEAASRVINVIPSLRGTPRFAAVLTHEMAHQAADELYGHLNAATRQNGSWTDHSHRCPAWSRAVEDVLQVVDPGRFLPAWHRGSGNTWRPWVPASTDWLDWRRVEPDEQFDGRELIGMREAACWLPGCPAPGPGVSL